MTDFWKNKTVLITGAASGIGKLMTEKTLRMGARVWMWDINQEALAKTQADFSQFGEVHAKQVDISDVMQIQAAATELLQTAGKLDVLINNAGIVVGKYFHEHSVADITRTMAINADAPMYVTQAFIGDMLQKNSGHICTIASSAGLISNPKMTVYVASKWAATGWSDSLRIEMLQLKKNIYVTTVTPYYINTGMFDGVKSRIPILKPDAITTAILLGIEKKKIYVSKPWSVRFVRLSQGLLPIWLFDWFVGSVLGIYKTMDHFKGRK
jgi:short-subunit dehydrogenase